MQRAPGRTSRAPARATGPLLLPAGRLQLRFEPAMLWARQWMCRDVELLRAVYPAIRDADWNTLTPRVQWTRREIHADRFALELKARYGGRKRIFEWDLRLEGSPDGTVVYAARGVALATFRSNRAGFCVLHPAEAAGQRCDIEHADGTSGKGVFPREISPHQPFFNLRAITHSPAPGLRVEVRMEGEVFEMEDQRNWTDASFKTYCRPLEQPWPFVLRRGDTIEQRIEVRVSTSRIRRRTREPARECVLALEGRPAAMPAIGVVRNEATPLRPLAARILRSAGMRHLRVDLDPSSPGCLPHWTRALRDAAKLGGHASLEVVLKADANGRQLERLARHVAVNPAPPGTRWLIVDRHTSVTTSAVFSRVAKLWSLHRIDGSLGAGVDGGFVDFNRARGLVPGIEFVGFGVDAQVHASDDASILETLSTYPLIVAQARRISGGVPVAVSPVRLGAPRTKKTHRREPRQRTAFGGVWMLASLAALARARAGSATFDLPRLDQRPPAPALQVLQAHASSGADRAVLVDSSDPRGACGIGLRTSAGLRLLIANLRSEEQRVRLQALPRGDRCATVLSSDHPALPPGAILVNDTLTLPPYTVVQIDISSVA